MGVAINSTPMRVLFDIYTYIAFAFAPGNIMFFFVVSFFLAPRKNDETLDSTFLGAFD